jgi:hypothetical protein
MMFRLPVDNAGPGAPPGDRGEAPRPRREFETKLCRSGVALDFSVRIPNIVLDRKPGTGQHVEDDDEVRVDPEDH